MIIVQRYPERYFNIWYFFCVFLHSLVRREINEYFFRYRFIIDTDIKIWRNFEKILKNFRGAAPKRGIVFSLKRGHSPSSYTKRTALIFFKLFDYIITTYLRKSDISFSRWNLSEIMNNHRVLIGWIFEADLRKNI